MYIYMYVYIYVCIYICMYIYMYVYIYFVFAPEFRLCTLLGVDTSILKCIKFSSTTR